MACVLPLVRRTGGVAATRFVAAETCPLAPVAAVSSRSVGTSVIICGSQPAGSACWQPRQPIWLSHWAAHCWRQS
eukprot:COSAG06_NODE_16809_length_979_cov_1.695455_1_plen_74_part_10